MYCELREGHTICLPDFEVCDIAPHTCFVAVDATLFGKAEERGRYSKDLREILAEFDSLRQFGFR